MKKRLLSLFLAFVMVLGMLPASAYAAETPFSVMLNDTALDVSEDGTYSFTDPNATPWELPAYTVTVPADTASDATVSVSGETVFAATDAAVFDTVDLNTLPIVYDNVYILINTEGMPAYVVKFVQAESGEAAENCLTVLSDAPATGTTTAGSLYELDLSKVFSDSKSHDVTYGFATAVDNQHTKIKNGIFYFSAAEGSYEVILTAECEGGKAEHKLTITVEKGNEGIAAQYGYDETSAASVTVYVTLSNDGYPIVAADGTVMSHLEVTVPYFDLSDYDLQDYYRYGTDGGKGIYTKDAIIQRPTGLHLYIYLLERYYMGLEENQCGKGAASKVLEYAAETEVYYMDGEKAYDSEGKRALMTSGGATSIYMVNFWGHDENLMYFRNHCYPLMSAGWGATSDYILLSDGDTWDVGMFTNWDFYKSGYFACFDQDAYTAEAGANVTIATQAWGTSSAAKAFVGKNGLTVGLYNSNWELVSELSYDSETGNSLTVTAPETAGTYYLMAVDPNAKDGQDACIAPATAILTVNTKTVCETCVDTDSNRLCDVCGKDLNNLPVLVEGVEDLIAIVQTGLAYQVEDIVNGKIFTDADGDSLTYSYRKSSDDGKTWGNWVSFGEELEHGGVNQSLVNSTAGTYTYEFKANDGRGDSEVCWHLTLQVMDVVPAEVNFYVGRDQNYNEETHPQYPVLELYRTAGIDENLYDYVGWFTNADGKTEYVYNPQDYTIIDGENDYVVIDEVQYELHDYEKIIFTNSAFDASDETATASGTVVNNYNMFYASIESGRYSTRAYGWNAETSAYDIYLGGQSMELPMEKDIYGGGGGDIYLRVVSGYTTSKKLDSTYFTAEDYYVEMIMPVTGSMIHTGDAYVSGNYTYFPFLSYAAGNASLYNIYAYPYDTDNYIFNQSINNTTAAGYTVVNKSISISTAVQLTVTVPQAAEFGLYFQFNNFNTKIVEPEGEGVLNEDGTKTITYKISKSNANYTWRLTDPSGVYVTKAGWLASLSAATEKTYTFAEGDATNKASHDYSQLGTAVKTRDEGDIQVFLAPSGFMSTSATYRVRAFRMWELINSDTANIMVEPDFNIQVLQGNASDVTLVNGGNAVSNWIDVNPTTTDIIAVNYDAIDMYSTADAYGSHGGLFPATNPERTGVFVITNASAGTADAAVKFNGGFDTDRGSVWDYNYDTWYYLNTTQQPTLDFTVTGTGNVAVSYATVITNAALKSTLSGWTDLAADESGEYHADLLSFRNAGTLGGTVIIKMTDSTGTSYRLVRVAEMTATVTNASNPGEPFCPGDDVTITFDGLFRAVNKVAGIFNPTTYYLRYTAGETEVNGKLAQYQQMDNTTITLTIPETLEFPEGESSMDYTFTDGHIYGSMYCAASPFGTLYEMTDTGVGTNFSAVGASFVLSHLADITVQVEQKVYYDVKLVVTDGENALSGYTLTLTDPDGNVLTADENGIYQDLGYGDYGCDIALAGYRRNTAALHLGSADAVNVADGILTVTIVLEKAAANAWDGATVTEPAAVDGIYQIGSGAELAWFAQTVNAGSTGIQGVLTADIDLARYNWTPIGNSSNKFAGSFDGQGHKVYNMSITSTTGATYQGLFGYVYGSSSAYASISNLTVDGSISLTHTSSVSTAYTGGVVGGGSYISLTNSHSNVDITINRVKGNWARVGGIVGSAFSSVVITNCSNSGDIAGYQYVGGIAGYAIATINGCYNSGTISGYQYVGGIAASGAPATITSCYNVGDLTCTYSYVGGIISNASSTSVLSNCFNAGKVTFGGTTSYAGAVIGYSNNASGTNANLYYLEGTYSTGIGNNKNTVDATAVTAETLASAEFVTAMNAGLETAAFNQGENHPVLTWQGGTAAPEITYGDADGNGLVNTDDVSKIVQYLNGNSMTAEEMEVSDVNSDGIVNMADVSLILQFINGAITQFPADT